ncbi:MAG: Flp pilus assembly protein CpaB [Planctomycetota bacterium]
MRGKSLALLTLALGCGLVASIGITQVVAKRSGDAPALSGETTTIFVALKDLGMGDVLSPDVLRLEQWPKDKLPPGALTDIKEVEGRRTRTRLWAGEPILESKLYGKNEVVGSLTPLIPKGYRVLGLKVDDVSATGNLIKPGERVDVLMFVERKPDKGIYETTTKTVMQDVKVFAVNDDVGMDQDRDPKTIRAKVISLLVTPEQATKLTLASEMGRIRLVMRRPDDDTQTADADTRPDELFGGGPDTGDQSAEDRASGGTQTKADTGGMGKAFLDILEAARRGAAATRTAAAGLAPGAPTWTMRILQPGAVNDITMAMVQEPSPSGATESSRWQILGDKPDGTPPAAASAMPTTTDENNGINTEPSAESTDATTTEPAGEGTAEPEAPAADGLQPAPGGSEPPLAPLNFE